MSDASLDEFLAHYGVKGMKWGVRKDRRTKTDAKVRNKRQKQADKRRHLSDDEIQKVINRISSERKMKELIDQDLNPGKTVTKKILSDSGQKVARTVISGAALLAIKVALDKKFPSVNDKGETQPFKFSGKDAASYLAPKPKK